MLLCLIRRPIELKENPEKFFNFENWAHERLFSKKGVLEERDIKKQKFSSRNENSQTFELKNA